MRKLSITIFLGCLLFSCKKNISEVNNSTAAVNTSENVTAAGITATPAAYWDSVFTRYGNGWTGGDAAFSVKLPDGRSLWLWGDSFLDTIYPNRTRPIKGFIHNQMVTTDSLGGNFTTYYGGTRQSPKAYFVPKDESQWYWPTSAFVNEQGSRVYVMMIRLKQTSGGGAFGFKITGTHVAVLDLPSLKINNIKKFYDGDFIDWSSACVKDEDGYVYLYGAESKKYNKYIHVARTSARRPFTSVEFFNGSNWVTDTAASTRIEGGVSETFSIFKSQRKYYLVSQGNLLSRDIYIWNAPTAAGPFRNKRLVYTTPIPISTTWTYNATAHTEFTNKGQLLIGYCMNTTVFSQLYSNVDTYRPYFIWVDGWK